MKVLIIGGGASGLMAALSAAEDGANRVTLLERQGRVGRKLLATGNGRCNLTNLGADASHYHGAAPEFVKPALERFGVQRTLDYFRALGMPTCFSELGIGVQDEATLQEMADCVTYHGARTIGTFRVMGREEILAAYRLANR